MMRWVLSHSCDVRARRLADRHYSRQKPGTTRFVGPGRCMVLLTTCENAYWVTSWPFAEYVHHAWPGAWMCSAFRNEGVADILSSELIIQALACTRWKYPDVPEFGMITFVDRTKVRSKRDPGYCFKKAGFHNVGKTKGGLDALQILPDEMPEMAWPLRSGCQDSFNFDAPLLANVVSD